MFEKLIQLKKIGGINCLFWKEGEIRYQESHGYKNLDTREAMTLDTIFRIASMTKPITSVLALMLYEANQLDLHDPVTKWFPQFRQMKVLNPLTGEYEAARRLITVLDLLTHRAGFTYSEFLTGPQREAYLSALGGDIDTTHTHDQWIEGLAGLPLVSQPGESFQYGRSTDLLGILISAIEGKPLGEVMQEKIFAPLAMTDTFFYVPDAKKHRQASNMGFDASGQIVNQEIVPLQAAFKVRPDGLAYESGGQGLWSTLGDYLQFAKIFITRGKSDGVTLLQPETLDLMCTNHLTPAQRQHATLMGTPIFNRHFGFGLGLAVVAEEAPYLSIPCAGSVGAVGWPGSYGGWWSADPAKKTISLLLTHAMTDLQQLAQGIGFERYEAIDIFAAYCAEYQ